MATDRAPAASCLISIDDLARILALSPRTVRRLDSAGRIPRPLKIGGAVRWRSDEIAGWIGAGCPPRKEWESLRNA